MATPITFPSGQPTARPIKSALIPPEGPKTVNFIIPFSGGTEFEANLQSAYQLGFISTIQTVFLDNTNSASDVTIFCPATGQSLVYPPGMQGYTPILSPTTPTFIFTSAGGVDLRCQLINVPMPANLWSATGGSAVIPNPLPVTGPLTDTQLRALAVSVSGPLTDTQLRATAVPVSGPLTDTQLRASAVPVSITSGGSTSTYFGSTSNGTFAATDATGSSRLAFTVTPTAGNTVLVQNEDTADNAYIAVGGSGVTVTAGGSSSSMNDGGLCVPPGGTVSFQLRATDTHFVAICSTGAAAILRVSQFLPT